MALTSYADYLAQNTTDNPNYPSSWNVLPWMAHDDDTGTPAPQATITNKGLLDYLDYAMPGQVPQDVADSYKRQLDATGQPGGFGDSMGFLTGAWSTNPITGNMNLTPQEYLRGRTDLPQEVLDALYNPSDARLHSSDPTVQRLNSMYKYQPESYGYLNQDTGGEFPIISKGKGGLGSWDLGDGKTLVPVREEQYEIAPGQSQADGSIGFLQGFNSLAPTAYNPDGSFNPSGWRVADLRSESRRQAQGHLKGVASVLGAALGSYLMGPAGGAAADIPAGSEGVMTAAPGTTATAGTATTSPGVFGQSSLDTGSQVGNKAIESGIKSYVMSGGDPNKALLGALSAPLASTVSSSIGDSAGDFSSGLGKLATNQIMSLLAGKGLNLNPMQLASLAPGALKSVSDWSPNTSSMDTNMPDDFDASSYTPEWSSISGDSGLNSYLGYDSNGNYVGNGINTDYSNFGLGDTSPGISGDSSLDDYLRSILSGVNTNEGTFQGAPAADTSWDQAAQLAALNNQAAKLPTSGSSGPRAGSGSGSGSGVNSALSGLSLALALAQALRKNPTAPVSSRGNQGQTFAPAYRGATAPRTKYASGGDVQAPGGLSAITAALAQHAQRRGLLHGNAGGQDDVLDIKAAPGEYVMDAETVSHLGDGSTDEGARKLDQMREAIRAHKRMGPLSQIAPKAKDPMHYLRKGK